MKLEKLMSALRDQLRRATCLDEVMGHLGRVAFSALSATDVATAHRALKKYATSGGLRIAFASNQTIEPLPDYMAVAAACRGIVTQNLVGGYNQYVQEILDPQSELRTFDPHVILLALSMRELSPRVHESFAALTRDDVDDERRRIVSHIVEWIEQAKTATSASFLVCNFPIPTIPQYGIADYSNAAGEMEFYARLNLDLLELLRVDTRAHFFDLDRVLATFGKGRAFDRRMYYIAHREWNEAVLPAVADEVLRYLQPLTRRTRKCLVVDLDNTLWGGIVGEDGVSGLKVGTGGAVEEAYRAVQYAVRALKDRGVILAISSKNNQGDVREVFDTRRDMPLRLDDFAAREINWNPKHEQLQRIAKALNIGTDSLVFCDDNPAECALIREMLPEVGVIELMGDPSDFADRLRQTLEFEKLALTDEDRSKTRQYQENIRRAELQGSVGSLDAYYESLQTEVIIRSGRDRDAQRVHQLFTKTNQFNVTTKRYAMGDVERFLHDDKFDLRVVDVKDRFGDLGTVGVVLIERRGDSADLDSFVMSCRAMGRQVETAIMNAVKADYLAGGRTSNVRAAFIPTKKNKPVETFFEDQGFKILEKSDNGGKTYRLDATDAAPIDCAHIRVSKEP